MEQRIPVIDHDSLYRGKYGVIHNTNEEEYQAYIASRQRQLDEKARLENLEKDVTEMKQSLDLILKLLQDKQ